MVVASDSQDGILGILGGLGPAATVNVMAELIEQTPATSDQEHVETIVYNDPKVPDRQDAILRSGESPAPRLKRNAKTLEDAGADVIAIASNTTHHYHGDVADAVSVPVPNMIELTAAQVATTNAGSVGILTTNSAIEIELFDRAFGGTGIDVVYPDDIDRLMDAIYTIKRGDEKRGRELYESVAEAVVDDGVDAVVLGCTEFSALPWPHAVEAVDPVVVLARHCIDAVKDAERAE